HDDARLHERDLRLEPGAAGGDLRAIRLGVNAELSPRLPLEVLDHIGHVDDRTIDARLHERPIEQLASWTHERMACEIFCVARLLAHHHDLGAAGSFAEDRLRAALIKVAGLTPARRVANRLEAWTIRNQIRDGR